MTAVSRFRLFAVSCGLAGIPFAMPAVAQQTPCADQPCNGAAADPAIVVTGSRIARPGSNATIPITAIGPEQIVDVGQVSIGDQLNQLPQLRATFSQANSVRFIGTAGQNILDLRGLGPERTLVLIDGRRHVSSSTRSFYWDVNDLPAGLIERVDVVTGGNSAIYGSDAVAGVVNFVLDRTVEGVKLRGQSGISDKGDSSAQFVSGVAGQAFGGGRGHVTLAVEYARQAALYLADRPQGRDRRQFQLTENVGVNLNPAAGALQPAEPATGNGISDTSFLTGLRRATSSLGGTFTAACPTAAATGESAAAFAARRVLACSGVANPGSSNPLAQFGTAYTFLADGTLVANGCTTDFRGFGSGNCIGGLGSTLRESGQFQPGLKRVNAALLAHFEVSPAVVPFVEGTYSHIDAVQEIGPSSGTALFSLANPFLTAQARSVLARVLPPGTPVFSIDRQNLDFGPRGEDITRETYRVVGGLRGSFNDDWRYELSANYGRFRSHFTTRGNFLTGRFANAANAVRNPAGQIVCALNADANAANDDPACVPVNLFGDGAVSQAALDYFGYTSSRRETATQFVLSGYVAGDTSQFLNLPGGPIGFAAGAEYRTEKQRAAFDPLTASGATFLNAVPDFSPPTYRVKEAFAELRLPLLADRPFARELAVEAAGRVSDYNRGTTGTVFAWNAGVVWAPVSDLRLRGSFQRSIRAPLPGDLYLGVTQTFNNAFADPCSQFNINARPNRVANCAAAGVPTTQTFTAGGVRTTEPFTNIPTGAVAAANRGNLALEEERGNSWTFGAVLQPRFAPELTLTLDYYDIDIRNVIFSLSPQTVLQRCYDSASGIDNPFCALVNRLPNGTFAGQATVFHAGTPVLLNNPGFSSVGQPFNYARLATRGIDADISWRHRFDGDAAINVRALASYLIARDSYSDITDPTVRDRIKSELGDPAWRFQVATRLDLGRLALSHKLQYVGKQILSLAGAGKYETFFGVDGRPAENPDAAPFPYYPSKFYNDFRAELAVNDSYRFYVGIDNAFDVKPPYDLLGVEGGSLYDPTGRFFYAGFRTSL